jgi:magnesium transporter
LSSDFLINPEMKKNKPLQKPHEKRESKYKKAGMAPGSLVYTGTSKSEPQILRLTWDEHGYELQRNLSLSQALIPVPEGKRCWIHLAGLSDYSFLEEAGKQFGIHRLLLEDILNVEQMPKVAEDSIHLFVTMKLINYSPIAAQFDREHISFVLGKDYLLSFREIPGTLADYICERFEHNPSLLSRGGDFLLYLLTDHLIDLYFVALEGFEEQIESFEEALLRSPDQFDASLILKAKKAYGLMRKAIVPLREDFRRLSVEDHVLIAPSTKIFLQDANDHLHNVSQSLDNLRETFSSLMDFYSSQNDLLLNRSMQRLTVISTIFLPLTFITGWYGMNFAHMPELQWLWGYPAVAILSFFAALASLYWMKRKRLD